MCPVEGATGSGRGAALGAPAVAMCSARASAGDGLVGGRRTAQHGTWGLTCLGFILRETGPHGRVEQKRVMANVHFRKMPVYRQLAELGWGMGRGMVWGRDEGAAENWWLSQGESSGGF